MRYESFPAETRLTVYLGAPVFHRNQYKVHCSQNVLANKFDFSCETWIQVPSSSFKEDIVTLPSTPSKSFFDKDHNCFDPECKRKKRFFTVITHKQNYSLRKTVQGKHLTAWLVEHCSLMFTVQCYKKILGLRGPSVNLSKLQQTHENAWHF